MNKTLFSSESIEWSTPQSFFNKLDWKYRFDLDVCATPENAKCQRYFTKKENGIAQSWEGARVWMNPPYGRDETKRWVRKAWLEREKAKIIVGLVPARTDTAWFHDYIHGRAQEFFIRGRLKFGDSKNSAPFPSLVFVFRKGCNNESLLRY